MNMIGFESREWTKEFSISEIIFSTLCSSIKDFAFS